MTESRTLLLVIADPSTALMTALSRAPKDIQIIVGNKLDELKALAPQADIILYAYYDRDLLNPILPLATRARWIHALLTGVEEILKPELARHPAQFTNGRGIFSRPLADWAIAVMLLFAFDLRRVIRQQEHGVWEQFVGSSLQGKTLGIVGYGSVGSAAAARARSFGMTIAALRRHPELSEGDPLVDQVYAPAQIKDLLSISDYVLVTAPLTNETRGMIGEAEIAAMKPGSVIINIGRGPVIDEAALIRVLEAGNIRGAALDVFHIEPLPADHPFWKMPNVLLSPHTADRIEEFLKPAFDCFFENLARFLKQKPLLNTVNRSGGY